MRKLEMAGRCALVTGGTRGIGRALVDSLVARDVRVIAVGRNATDLDHLVDAHGDRVVPMSVDLADPAALDDLVSNVSGKYPELSILINNAAVQTEIDLIHADRDGTVALARKEISLDLQAPVAICIGLLPLLMDKDSAAIVNITTALAIAPKAVSPVYCAAKAGLRNFTRSLRYQCESRAPWVRVSEIVMALVDTDMTKGRGRGKISPERAALDILRVIESGRAEVWVEKTKILRALYRVAPSLVYRMMR